MDLSNIPKNMNNNPFTKVWLQMRYVMIIACALLNINSTLMMTGNLWNAFETLLTSERKHCECTMWTLRRNRLLKTETVSWMLMIHFALLSCIVVVLSSFSEFSPRLLTVLQKTWGSCVCVRLCPCVCARQLRKLTLPVWVSPSEVKSFDLDIATFLWRQSTQHEGVMPVAPEWAGIGAPMISSCP